MKAEQRKLLALKRPSVKSFPSALSWFFSYRVTSCYNFVPLPSWSCLSLSHYLFLSLAVYPNFHSLCVFQCLNSRKNLLFNQIDLLLLLLLPLLWNSLVFYLRYSQFSLDLYSCKLSLHEILPTCYLNLFKFASLKSAVLTLLLSPYFSVDHNTIILSPSSQFQPLHFQPFISKSVKIFPLLTLLDFLYLPIKKLSSAHSWRLLNTLPTFHYTQQRAHSFSLKLTTNGREWPKSGQLHSLALQNWEAILCPQDLAAALC